jgi:hypothetical protein
LIFRETASVWGKIHGEVIFDELFVITAMRSAMPNVFNYINNNIQQFQNMSSNRINSTDTDKKR